jgi:nitrate reductase gamma subunit
MNLNKLSIFAKKTFWLNVAGMTVEVVQLAAPIVPIPPGTVTIILGVANIFMRRLTDSPARFVSPVKE